MKKSTNMKKNQVKSKENVKTNPKVKATAKTISNKKVKVSNRSTISVIQLKQNGKKVKSYKSLCAASEATGVNVGSISKAVRGIINTAGGFRWVQA